MAKKFSPQSIVHRLVFELRYDYGYTYLDRCGQTINDILKKNDGWKPNKADPQGGALVHSEKGLAFSFNSGKLDLLQQQSAKIMNLLGGEEFAIVADNMANAVIDRLGLEKFTRIGFRVWRLFGAVSLEEARARVKALVDIPGLSELGCKEVDEISFKVIAKFDDGLTRIAVVPVEQSIEIDRDALRQAKTKSQTLGKGQKQALLAKMKAKKAIEAYPQFAVLVDTDHYLEYPPLNSDLSIKEFILAAYTQAEEIADKILGSQAGGRK